MSSKHLLIVTPTRNEAGSAPLVMAEIAQTAHTLSLLGWTTTLLVIDDGSTDGTADVVRREARLRNIAVRVEQGPGSGLSRALTTGIRSALAEHPTMIATFDFDGQHDASQLSTMVERWERSGQIDAVFGSRFASGSTVTGVRGVRKLLSRAAQIAIKLATAGPRPPSDSTTSLRIFSPRLARSFLDEVPSIGLDGYRLFSWFAVYTSCRFSFTEIPIDFRPRLNGISKLRTSELLSFAIGLRDLREMSKDWTRERTVEPSTIADDAERRLDAEVLESITHSTHGTVLVVSDGAALDDVERIRRIPTVIGVDCAEQVLSRASGGVPAVAGPSLAEFDTVLYLNGIETTDCLLAEIRAAFERCRTGGHIVIVASAMECIFSELDRRSGRLRRVRSSRLKRCLREAGFEVLSMRYVHPGSAVAHWMRSRSSSPTPRSHRRLREGTSVSALPRISMVTQKFWGDLIVATAYKPANIVLVPSGAE